MGILGDRSLVFLCSSLSKFLTCRCATKLANLVLSGVLIKFMRLRCALVGRVIVPYLRDKRTCTFQHAMGFRSKCVLLGSILVSHSQRTRRSHM